MSTRERHVEERTAGGGGGNPGPDNNLEAIRQQGADLLAAGDAAIQRSLSQNSEGFLQYNEQQGGQ